MQTYKNIWVKIVKIIFEYCKLNYYVYIVPIYKKKIKNGIQLFCILIKSAVLNSCMRDDLEGHLREKNWVMAEQCLICFI